jgi:hypothetical protein
MCEKCEVTKVRWCGGASDVRTCDGAPSNLAPSDAPSHRRTVVTIAPLVTAIESSAMSTVRIALANIRAAPGGYRPVTFADPANTFHEKAILCRAAENTCYFASVNYALGLLAARCRTSPI